LAIWSFRQDLRMLVGDHVLREYDAWVEREEFAVRTRAAYGPWAREFAEHLQVGTVATRLVRDHRHDLVQVAHILGHADVKTTRHYARSGLDDRRAALEDLAD
jgi:site-specific recombinase XerD